MDALSPKALKPLILKALQEDQASRDITSKSVLSRRGSITAALIAKNKGIAAGVKVAALCFSLLDPKLRVKLHIHSGQPVSRGTKILTVTGSARSIFAAERTALNFLGHLSGIATVTRAYVDKVKGTGAAILDTRKTIPGLRVLEKTAVHAGGGQNHRIDLQDEVLIKSNHLRAFARDEALPSAIWKAILRAKKANPHKFTSVEVVNMKELEQALSAKPNMVLLDNWRLRQLPKAVALRNRMKSRSLLEVSGGVTLSNVRAIAKTGVERISIGRLTHSAPSLDVSLKVL